jgi:hypothetical protein
MFALFREMLKLLRCLNHRVHNMPCKDRCPFYPCSYEWRDDI